MATVSTLATSLPSIKYVPFDPSAPKRKMKPKSKAKNTPNITGHGLYENGSHGCGGEWTHIDDFQTDLSDSNALHSLDPGLPAASGATGPSGSLQPDCEGDLSTILPQILQSQQPCQTADVGEMDLTVDGLFDRSSPEFPFILEGGAAVEHDSTTHVEPSNGASGYQENGYHAAVGNEGYRAGQYGDLDPAGMRALSVEDTEGIRYKRLPAENEPLIGDVDVTSRPPLARKRMRPSSAETIISSAEVSDVTPEPELEDPRSAKRRRLACLDPASTFKSTLLPTPSGPAARSRASSEPSPEPLDNDSKGDSAESPVLPLNDVLDVQNGGDGLHARGTGEELLHSSRQSISPSERREGDQDFSPDSEKGEEESDASNGGVEESHDDELNQVDEAFCRASGTSPQQRKPSNRPVRKKGRNPSKNTLGPRDRSANTTTPRQVSSPQSRHLPRPRTERVTWPCSSRLPSSETKAGDEPSNSHGPSANMAYPIADVTVFPVPNGSSIVTAIVRCSESKLPPNPIAQYPNILGERGQVIRMTQLSLDSWFLLGYRCDNGAPDPCTCWNQNSNPHTGVANHDAGHLDIDVGEEDDDGDEGASEYMPHAIGSDQGFSRDDMRCRQRTHIQWVESDKERLLSYKDKMGMEWKDIFKHFPDRTPGAIRTRWHMLHRK